MAKNVEKRVAAGQVASVDEIQAAVAALADTDWYRLQRVAEYQAFLSRRKTSQSGGDLLNEAFERLLDGRRKWDNSREKLVEFLCGAMESIANSWRRKKVSPTEAAILSSDLVTENEEGGLTDPVEEFATDAVDANQMLIYKESLDQIEALFADDEEIQMIIAAFGRATIPLKSGHCGSCRKKNTMPS